MSDVLQRRLARERAARKAAEELLERKSLELYRANEKLEAMAAGLEQQVELRTKELVQARDEAESANRHKSEFLSRMSHELRTPLNAILGFSQLLETDPDEPMREAHLRRVQEISAAGHHLLELIDEILDLSRIEVGRIELTMKPIRISELVDDCLTLVSPLARPRGVRISVQSELTEPAYVRADRTRLKQVLLNLLSNAIKYNCEDGSVFIRLSPAPDGVLVKVRDTGTGLSEEEQGRVFEPFERLSNRLLAQGTGIGLTISRRLVELMGGEIGLESEVGVGTEFWVRLGASDAPLEAPRPSAPPPLSPPRRTGGPRTVLYIEDHIVNVEIVQVLLRRRDDVELLVASDAEQGLAVAARERPDAILMDLQLPGMSGTEALHELRADPELASTPVIAFSANALPSDIEQSLADGFDGYVTKPVRMAELMAALDAVMG